MGQRIRGYDDIPHVSCGNFGCFYLGNAKNIMDIIDTTYLATTVLVIGTITGFALGLVMILFKGRE